jgi:potassium-transporting ATPase KdpC subunit
MSNLRPALAITGALTLITGLAYPLAITGAARILFPAQAAGSLLRKDGVIVGSSLIGQHTEDPKYFWGRLSATAVPTDAANSTGSNLAPSNPDLRANAARRIKALREADPGNTLPVPVDLVTSSGSGLDPHLTPAAVDYQLKRVARVRNRPEAEVRALVARATEGRTLGLFGEPRVNVLKLNLSLDGARP